MTSETGANDTYFRFQVSESDFPHLVHELFNGAIDPKSPIASITTERGRQSGTASAQLSGLTVSEQVATAVNILAAPDLIMNCRTGGGVPTGYLSACHAKSVNPDAFAVVTPSFERAFMVTLFEDQQQFLTAWIAANASAADTAVVNLISSKMRYESLVYIFHAIDLYRRTTMQNLLQHSADTSPTISVDEFTGSLGSSTKSGDLRWLVPCFLALTPGLDQYAFQGDITHVEELTRRDVLYVEEEDGTPTETLTYGDVGRSLGIEFHRSWLSAAGYETSVRTSRGWRSTGRAFLAPTSLCNHLFSVSGSASEAFVDHAALSRDDLADVLAQQLQRTGEAVSDANDKADENAAAAVEKGNSNPAPKFCNQCGNALSTGKKFCTACGAPVDIQTA
ncbi:MAG: hypothetical protein NXI27_17160 [Alphaproteobacteria bacterium]|nr:hypothetical protein [Alphaproteobacteria bacterium]